MIQNKSRQNSDARKEKESKPTHRPNSQGKQKRAQKAPEELKRNKVAYRKTKKNKEDPNKPYENPSCQKNQNWCLGLSSCTPLSRYSGCFCYLNKFRFT